MSTETWGGEWTDEKLGVLRGFLEAYLAALKNKPFRLGYVDAFAGAGYRIDGRGGPRQPGVHRGRPVEGVDRAAVAGRARRVWRMEHARPPGPALGAGRALAGGLRAARRPSRRAVRRSVNGEVGGRLRVRAKRHRSSSHDNKSFHTG